MNPKEAGAHRKLTLPPMKGFNSFLHIELVEIHRNSMKFTLTQRIYGAGIFAYNHKNQLNVGKYTIHASYG